MRRILAAVALLTLTHPAPGQPFTASFAHVHDRIWVGPELWANPMEDWRVHGGRLECTSAGPNRSVHALTREADPKGKLTMSVRVGLVEPAKGSGAAGFRVGIRDEIDDYRARLIYGQGLDAGVTTDGILFIGPTKGEKAIAPALVARGVELRLEITPGANLTLTAHDTAGKQVGAVTARSGNLDSGPGLALVCNPTADGKPPKKKDAGGAGARFWFDNWKIGGDVRAEPSRAFGPVLWSMHTLSRGVLKMTAQMPPVGDKESQTVRLQVKDGGSWKTVGEEKIDPLARTATFRIAKWDATRDVPYRLAYTLLGNNGSKEESHYPGTVRRDPTHKDTLILAALSCSADYTFPHREIVKNLTYQNPDLLFFAGDQIYEYVGGFPLIRTPTDRACLNYLRKWYLHGMAFGELMRDRPTVCIPDDHDVYQGNIWGNGGNPITLAEHERGGYVMHPDFVNCVHRTQTAHLPDPFDPAPIQQKIRVYYCDLLYGRVGFAVIADRMFKSGPKGNVPEWPGRPDHVRDPKIDVKSLDKPGLHLLGERQERFLRHWSADWQSTDMKCVLSQTIFCNLANYHGPKQEYLVADLDSGGWPQSGRNRALELMRRGFALHVAGDQHLASLVHQGIEAPGDANWSFCVPAIANFYPRSWKPDKEGLPVKNRSDARLPNTGDYLDGLKNPIRVAAIANPETEYRKGRLANLHDKASGYGVVRFHRKDRTMTLECWRLLVDVSKPKPSDQFPGWPRTLAMLDNYGRKPLGHLPELHVTGMNDPVVQVIHEKSNEIVYTLRIAGNRFRPMVFAPGPYTVRVGEPGTPRLRVLRGVEIPANETAILKVDIPNR